MDGKGPAAFMRPRRHGMFGYQFSVPGLSEFEYEIFEIAVLQHSPASDAEPRLQMV